MAGSGPFVHPAEPINPTAGSGPAAHPSNPVPTLGGTGPYTHTSSPAPASSQGLPSEAEVQVVPGSSQGLPSLGTAQVVPSSTQGLPSPGIAQAVPTSSQGLPSAQLTTALPPVPPVPPGPPPVPAQPGVPVSPPTPNPDITGVAAVYTDPDLTPPQRRALIAKANSLSNLRVTARIASQRYTGPGFPFGPSINGTLGPKDDLSVVMTSYINILSTPRGSVVYDLSIGSDVPMLVFEPLDDITLNLIRYYTRKDLSEQEPRAAVRQVFARVDPVDPNRVLVNVGTSLVGDPDGTIFGVPIVLAREAVGGI